jgi:hypothetical protein
MAPDAKIKASGIKGLLLVPFRARGHIAEKLGPGWAIAADAILIGCASGLLLALVLDVPAEAKLAIFAGAIAVAAISAIAIGILQRPRPKQRDNIQP